MTIQNIHVVLFHMLCISGGSNSVELRFGEQVSSKSGTCYSEPLCDLFELAFALVFLDLLQVIPC